MSTVAGTPTSIQNNNNNQSTKGSSNNSSNGASRCNLIVNYLPQSLKEHDFCQLFAKIGPIKTCKLMYDKQTGYSFGYGFVDYQNLDDANRAIESLNGFQIEHKRLKVAFARPNCEDTKNTNLYIRNLPTTYDENNLNDLFSQYGEVVQVRILRDPVTNFSRRIGFVIMSTKQMAQTGIENLDNQIPPNGTEPIYVKYADEEGKKRQPQRNNNHNHHHHHHHHNNNHNHNNNSTNNNNVFHPHNQTAPGMNGLQNLGKMKSNRGSQQNRYNPISASYGYALSNFAQNGSTNFEGLINGFHNSFMNQTQQNNSHHQNHHHVGHNNNNNQHHQQHHQQQQHNNNSNNNNNRHNQHHHHQQQQQQHNTGSMNLLNFDNQLGEKGGHIIYVYGIGPHASESDLYTLFQNVGPILRVNVIKNQKTGLGKGYGFVVFEHYEEACFAVQQMNGFIFNNRPLQVAFKAFNKNQ